MLDEIDSLNPNESKLERTENFQNFDSHETPNLDRSNIKWIMENTCYYLKPPPTALLNVRVSKAELLQVGIFFRNQFPSLGIFTNKKMDFEKTKTTW